jgi:hypothetical protein
MTLRRSARLVFFGLVVLLLFTAAPAPASAATPVKVRGRVANGTKGGSLPPGLVVNVIQIGPEGDEVARKQSGVGSDQTFLVEGFDLEAGARFAATADYLGVSYTRVIDDAREALAADGGVTADLLVYEHTDDEAALSITSDVLTIVGGDEEPFEVIQLQRVSNSSDRTFVGRTAGEGKQVLRLPIPSGAFDVLPLEGISLEQLSTISGGIVTGTPVVPGERPVSFIYKVRAPGDWRLSRRFFYPTKQADILVGTGLRLESPEFKFEEGVTLEDVRYGRYRGGPFEPGDELRATVGPPSALPGPGLFWGLVGGLGLLVLLGAGTFAVRRRSRPVASGWGISFFKWRVRGGPALGRQEEPAFTTEERRRELVDQIAALDDEFERGELSEDDYHAERQSLKEQLSGAPDEPIP